MKAGRVAGLRNFTRRDTPIDADTMDLRRESRMNGGRRDRGAVMEGYVDGQIGAVSLQQSIV